MRAGMIRTLAALAIALFLNGLQAQQVYRNIINRPFETVSNGPNM
jgi:hypothetical protein